MGGGYADKAVIFQSNRLRTRVDLAAVTLCMEPSRAASCLFYMEP